MIYLNRNFPNIRQQLLILFFLSFILTSCNNRKDKQLYGTYENDDTSRLVFSRITFYENNNYSYYSSTCFGKNRDSGNFTFTDNTLSFHSFNLPLLDKNIYNGKNLNTEKFQYDLGRILYIRNLSPPNRSSHFDTILIGQKKN